MMNKLRLIVASALCAVPCYAGAELYLGLGVGSADFEVDLTGVGGGTIEDSGTASKLFAGYQINDYLAVEAAYYNFAETSVAGIELTPGSGNLVSASADMNGLAAIAVASYQVRKNIILMAKAGMFSWDADISLGSSTASNDGSDAMLGVGAAYGFTRELFMQAEWETFQSDNPETSMLSIGVSYRFK